MQLKVLLVDDEFLALNLLENFVGRLPDLEIVDKVKSPIKALEILNSTEVDLLFLDIQMPSLSGVNLLGSLANPPVTIFTTAYAEYATKAFDLNAIDYLLKPFSFERFLQAVNKAKAIIAQKTPKLVEKVTPTIKNVAKDFMSAKVDGKIQKVYFNDIIYIEGLREYVRIVCEGGKKFVILESLKKLENSLPEGKFLRVHKSYIVAKEKVGALDGNMLEIGKERLPISRGKRDWIIEQIF
ncbi:MAG: response regulator transcription factor [Aureispira sp.]|nr:response regulator transcription factor [Aureispira sp.]